MLKWLRKKMKKGKHPRTKPHAPQISQDDTLHIYEEINDLNDDDDVFVTYTRTGSLPSKSRKYPLFRPDPQPREALYSIAKIPGIDHPRPPSTSSSRRKLSFDGPAKPWSPAKIVDHYDVISDTDDDDEFYEYDMKSDRQSRPRQRKPSVARSDTGNDHRRVTLVRDSSLRSSISRTSDASSGFFSEDTDIETMHRTSTRRKNRSCQPSDFIRQPSLKQKHLQVNEAATPIYQKPHPARGYFRAPVQCEPNTSIADYLSPVKFVSSSQLPSHQPSPRDTYAKVKRRSEGFVRPPPMKPRHDVFKKYEVPQFIGQTTSLPCEPLRSKPVQPVVCDQPCFWSRNRNQLLQDVIRVNYDRQMSLFV